MPGRVTVSNVGHALAVRTDEALKTFGFEIDANQAARLAAKLNEYAESGFGALIWIDKSKGNRVHVSALRPEG